MMHNVGVTRLAHINRKGGYTVKYLDKILVGSGSRNLMLRERGFDSKRLRFLTIFERWGGNLGSDDVDAHTKTHCLEAGTYDDGVAVDVEVAKKSEKMRLKRDDGWICSWTWNDSMTGDGLWVTISN